MKSGILQYQLFSSDFVILSQDKRWLENLVPIISKFLEGNLKLSLHPDKVFIKTLASGVDFLGWIHFPDHRVLRTSSKNRMIRNLKLDKNKQRLISYKGLLSHGNAHKLSTVYLD